MPQVGKPVTGKELVGRENEISLLMEYLQMGQSVVLVAPRRFGKTSLVLEALTRLKDAHKAQDVDACEKLSAELNTAFQAASEEMYKAAQEAGTSGGAQDNTSTTADSEVTDVDFEEVKDDK